MKQLDDIAAAALHTLGCLAASVQLSLYRGRSDIIPAKSSFVAYGLKLFKTFRGETEFLCVSVFSSLHAREIPFWVLGIEILVRSASAPLLHVSDKFMWFGSKEC